MPGNIFVLQENGERFLMTPKLCKSDKKCKNMNILLTKSSIKPILELGKNFKKILSQQREDYDD